MSDRTILDALDLLHAAYPTERVSIWAEFRLKPEDPKYTAAVGVCGDEPVFAWADDPATAAERLINKAGDRDPTKMKQKRIEKLRAELTALEAAPEPTTVPEPATA